MAFNGLWHASFTVSDMEASLEFYCGLLGLELHHQQVQCNEYTSKLVGFANAQGRTDFRAGLGVRIIVLAISGADKLAFFVGDAQSFARHHINSYKRVSHNSFL